MKSIINRLAQRWTDGPLENPKEDVEKMEKHLKSPPPPFDEKMCSDIMGLIREENIVMISPGPIDDGMSNWGLKFGVAAVLAFGVTMLAFWNPGKEEEALAGVRPVENVEPEKEVVATPAETFATMLQQQEYLRRDARKLGMHLQERVIIFQSGN